MSEHPTTAEVDLIVSAIPVPVLISDYTPILERFAGMDGEVLREMLLTDEALFSEALHLPRTVAASPEWIRLYGSPFSADLPELPDRDFTPSAYPDLHQTLAAQFTAPFRNVSSIVGEHTAPTLIGDVVVRSHWQATGGDVPRWDKIVIVDLDVTDLRTAQRDLEAILDTKERLVESKDQLIASVSHEIRTPLAAIVGFAELLRDGGDLSAPERAEMIGLLVQQSADLTNIVDDLLVSAKADLGQLELVRVTVDVGAQAAQAIEGLNAEKQSAITLPESTARGIGDPGRVRQVIRNLISNAFRYGGPEIRIEVTEGADTVALRVVDNGAGIAPGTAESMFEPYHRSGVPHGTVPALGLGLHISRTLARKMGGDLTYRYEDTESVFELTLLRSSGL
jgi:signal transduction histidine kinase